METNKYIGEIWKDIPGWEGLYQVSSFGRVKSLTRYKKILKLRLQNNGYLVSHLSYQGSVKACLVHRLVAKAFIPNPNNLPQVNHKNEDKTDNFIWINEDGTVDLDKSNLEWCTEEYNRNYGTRNERISKNKMGNVKSSVPVKQYTLEGVFVKTYPSTLQAQRETGINRTAIRKVAANKIYNNRISKTAGGFIWKYE